MEQRMGNVIQDDHYTATGKFNLHGVPARRQRRESANTGYPQQKTMKIKQQVENFGSFRCPLT